MVELLEDVDASGFDAAMLFLDEYVDPSLLSPSAVSDPFALTLASSSSASSASTSSSAPPAADTLTAHLLDEHALFATLLPPMTPTSPPLAVLPAHAQLFGQGAPLRIAPLAVDYFPLGVELDRPVFSTVLHPITAQTFSPSDVPASMHPHTTASSSSPTGSSSSSSGSQLVAKKPSKKPKRPPTYNSNKAREERRQELIYLRRKVVEMENDLSRIHEKKARKPTTPSVRGDAGSDGSSSSADAGTLQRSGVWEEIASRQLEERRRAERENEQLKVVLETQIKIAKSLETILNKRSTLRGLEASGLGKRKRVFANSVEASDQAIFEELLLRIEGCYLEVDRLFDGLGIGALESSFRDARMRDGENGMFLEVFANNVLPFSVHTAGKAAWQYFAHNINHLPFRQYYERSRENMKVTEDTIVENIGLELHANNTKALFRLKQVLRRYVEEDRVVIVWTSIIDPIEFGDKPFAGYYFRESGYMLLTKPKTFDPSDHCVLKTCYVITPEFSSGSPHGEGDEIIGELTEFVLSGTAASIAASHQVIENMLMMEALKKRSTTSTTSTTTVTTEAAAEE